jgi:hypothetical protein
MRKEFVEAMAADPSTAVPLDAEEFATAIASPMYRLNNLYKIVTKDEDAGTDDDADTGRVVVFKMNDSQRSLAENIWYRNIVPKARQRGITTFSCVLALDYAIFNKNFQVGIICHTDGAAKKIFRDKVVFAWRHLPEQIKAAMPLKKQSAEEMVFDNDSSIVVCRS